MIPSARRTEAHYDWVRVLSLSVSFDGRSVTYGFGELDTLVPAYAASIHEGQEGCGIPGRGDSSHDAALRHVAA